MTTQTQEWQETASGSYMVLLENEKVRVLDWYLKPGHKTRMHAHPDYFEYAFSDSQLKYILNDGSETERTFETGQAVFLRAQTHSVENIGPNEAHHLVVELKHN